MPIINITILEGVLSEEKKMDQKREISKGITKTMVDALGVIQDKDVVVIFNEKKKDCLASGCKLVCDQ